MLLSDLFDQLAYGELSALEMGGADDEGIIIEQHKRIVPHINLGLTELHKRFLLREEEVTIRCQDHIETYVLTPRYAATNTKSTAPYKYIHDTEFEPFKDNVLKIEKVFNEDGQELYLNETEPYIIRTELHHTTDRAWTVNTPSYNTIQIPYPMETNALLVEYRANHPHIAIKGLKPYSTEVDIPAYLLNPLLLFIASRVFSNMGGDSMQVGMAYMARYEASLVEVERLGLLNTMQVVNQKLEVNQWV